MKILIVSSEIVPFAKTGGLADVSGALPKALASLGNDVRAVMPKYGCIDDDEYNLRVEMPEVIVNFAGSELSAIVKKAFFPNTNIPVYFIQNDDFFNRNELYVEQGEDYPDNALRFAFFCMATLWFLKGIDWQPDVIMCNDWQSGFVPIFLRNVEELRSDRFYSSIKTLFTLHNLSFQGIFPADVVAQIGLDWSLFSMNGLEFYGKMNTMKGGIVFSNAISTVSKRYAQEITTPEFGYGLEGILSVRKRALCGIMNGIDYSVWNPETDKLIPANFSAKDLSGKPKCKTDLQRICNLPQNESVPLIGMISRIVAQKGFDLLAESMEKLMELDIQMVILGTGLPHFHEIFAQFAKKHPSKLSVNLTFDNRLAHEIEAGADMFLMPSKFEPCGLNQLYSLKYGTIPIVRKTGGLVDSIKNVSVASLRKSMATGFVFSRYTTAEFVRTVKRAISMFNNDKDRWKQLMLIAMNQDFSWDRSAKEYMTLFRKIRGRGKSIKN